MILHFMEVTTGSPMPSPKLAGWERIWHLQIQLILKSTLSGTSNGPAEEDIDRRVFCQSGLTPKVIRLCFQEILKFPSSGKGPSRQIKARCSRTPTTSQL